MVGRLSHLIQSLKANLVNDRASRFGLIKQGMKPGIIPELGNDPDPIEGTLALQGCENGMPTIDDIRGLLTILLLSIPERFVVIG